MMACACLWSVLSLGSHGCGPLEARALDSCRCLTLAPQVPGLRSRPGEKGQLHSHAAAAIIVTATIVINGIRTLLPKHLDAFPPTSRSYRSTALTGWIMRLLLVSVFLPGSRATVATAIGNGDDMHVGGSPWAEAVGDGRPLANVTENYAWHVTSLPWIVGGLFLVTLAGTLCHMMPGLGGGSRTESFNYRIPPAWSPQNDHQYTFRAYMTDIFL